VGIAEIGNIVILVSSAVGVTGIILSAIVVWRFRKEIWQAEIRLAARMAGNRALPEGAAI
jgi:hypothetical protein